MFYYWDELDLAEAGYMGDPLEIKQAMVELIGNYCKL